MAFGGNTFGGKTFGGYASTGTPTIPPAANVAAVAYLYKNVGLHINSAAAEAGVAYLYKNVITPGFVSWHVGVIRPRLDASYGVAYLYKNVT